MTVYSFRPNPTASFVNWSDQGIWDGGIVPDAPDADVDFPTVTNVGSGSVYTSFVSVQPNESFTVRSVALRDYLLVRGSLSVGGTLTSFSYGEIDMYGGTLTAGAIVNDAFDIQGNGHLVVGTLTNHTMIAGNNLIVDATALVNTGILANSNGTTTVNVGAGGLSGFASGRLGAGELRALSGGTLALHGIGPITVDASTITLGGGIITSYDPAVDRDVALTASLRSVASAGLLVIQDDGNYRFDDVNVAGTLALLGAGRFGANQLTIASGGLLQGSGTVDAAIRNDGLITAGQSYSGQSSHIGTLLLNGAITGNGSIEILSGHRQISRGDSSYAPTLEIAGATGQNIIFDDDLGTLVLDRPGSFTGTISTPGLGGTIILAGIALASITSTSYRDGMLTLQQGSTSLALKFTGNHSLGNFTLAAGPQALSSDPPSLKITIAGHGLLPGQDFNGDGHSDILWQNVNGSVSTWHATGTGSSDGIVQDTFDARVDPSWKAIDSFDYNGDGRADILWQNRDGTIAVWAGTATGFTQSSYVGSLGLVDGAIAATGDFNGDGRDDVLYRNADGSIGVQGSNGTDLVPGIRLGYSHGTVGTNWLVEGAADFDGNGKADILWRNTDGSLSTWNANGATGEGANFRENSWFHQPIDLTWHVVGLGDFNGDSKADILWRNDNGAVSVWTSTGSAGFAENQFNATAAGNWSVAEVGDFNGDGLADLLWRNTAGQISIWHSTGSQWAQNTYFDSSVGTDWTIAAHHFVL